MANEIREDVMRRLYGMDFEHANSDDLYFLAHHVEAGEWLFFIDQKLRELDNLSIIWRTIQLIFESKIGATAPHDDI